MIERLILQRLDLKRLIDRPMLETPILILENAKDSSRRTSRRLGGYAAL
jgi:hypothetical protein